MTRIPTKINEEIIDYIRGLFAKEDKFLTDLVNESIELNFPQIAIAPEQGNFLQFLLKAINARYVLEIGSLFGYSAFVMARVLPDGGKLIAVEIDKKRAEFIRKKAIEANLSEKIEVVNSSAMKFLETFKPDCAFDFVFLDADKENYINYLNKITSLLRTGGIVAADNALAFGNIANRTDYDNRFDEVAAMWKFNEYLVNHPSYVSSIVTLGDGIALGIKK